MRFSSFSPTLACVAEGKGEFGRARAVPSANYASFPLAPAETHNKKTSGILDTSPHSPASIKNRWDILEGLIFGETYLRREICVSENIGLAL